MPIRSVHSDIRFNPVRNWHSNPKAEISASGYSAANASTVARVTNNILGTPQAIQVIFPTGGVTDSGVNLTSGLNSDLIGGRNRRYTLSFSIVTDFTGDLRLSRQGTAISGSPVTVFSVVANVTQRFVFQFFTNSTAAGTLAMYILRGKAGQTGSFFVSKVMIVDDSAGYDAMNYGDGDLPGWKWDGTAKASSSVGYPYTLASIMGVQPWLEIFGANQATDATKIAATDDRALFAVWDMTGVKSLYAQTMRLADSLSLGTRNMALYAHQITDSAFGRIQTGTTTPAGDYIDLTTGIMRNGLPGRRLGSGRTFGGATTIRWSSTSPTGVLLNTNGPIPVGAQHQANVITGTASADVTPVHMLAYKGEVSDAQRDAVHRWLANRWSFYLA